MEPWLCAKPLHLPLPTQIISLCALHDSKQWALRLYKQQTGGQGAGRAVVRVLGQGHTDDSGTRRSALSRHPGRSEQTDPVHSPV